MRSTLIIATLISLPLYAHSDSVVGKSFIDSPGGSSMGTEAIVIGQKDINRHVVMLRTIQADVVYSSPDIGYTNENEEIPNDTYRINCKENTFAVASKVTVQWESNDYMNGWRYDFSGKDVRSTNQDSFAYTHPDMIKIFKKACK